MYVHDCFVKARHDDLMRAAARSRLAAQTSVPTARGATASSQCR